MISITDLAFWNDYQHWHSVVNINMSFALFIEQMSRLVGYTAVCSTLFVS